MATTGKSAHFIRLSAMAVISACGPGLDKPPEAPSTDAAISFAELGIVASLGEVDLNQERDAILANVTDAAWVGEVVAVLDARDPWIRFFDSSGKYLYSALARGDGPLEARAPIGLDGSVNKLLLADLNRIVSIDPAGVVLSQFQSDVDAYRTLGAVYACYERLFIFSPGRQPGDSMWLVEVSEEGDEVGRTAVGEAPQRAAARSYSPWFAAGDSSGITLYPEEEGSDRLFDVTCDGGIRQVIAIDSIGPGPAIEGIESDGQGGRRGTVRQPQPPFPAGLARFDGAILWASQRINQDQDSVTTITVFRPGESNSRVEIGGWYQLLDSDESGRLLFSTKTGPNRAWRHTPKVLIVDGKHLIRLSRTVGNEKP